jgi:hypothetical protein
MISMKQKTIALSVLATAAVLVLFASGPLVATDQAHAYWGRGWGWGGGWGGCGCGGFGGPWGGGGFGGPWGGGGWW